MLENLSLAQARRIALAAQGLDRLRPEGVLDAGTLSRAISRLNLLQIDSVNVVARAHYLPLFSRLGAYRRDLLEAIAWGPRPRLFEYWAHEASLLPLDLHRHLRWRMARAERGLGIYGGLAPFAGERRAEAIAVMDQIHRRGPLCASDLEGARGQGGWWGWSDGKRALEWLFWSGLVTTRTRRGTFERVYDLTERVIPAAILSVPTPPEAEAHRGLLARAARALGIATLNDLRDYFRQSSEDARPRVAELVEAGELLPVTVAGWTQPAYLHRDARRPRRATARALVAPFDPIVWERARTERLFGLRYRIEIYTPAAKRLHGYYVLPFLLGDTIAARVDLKADRKAGVLRVQNAHREPGAPAALPEALAEELRLMAGWLNLDRIVVGQGGDLAPALAGALGLQPDTGEP
ncbi:crosslink repair DNA glycosylase YcaQ family protein [Lichenihabitans sp. Uapishka_5]|uniref:winged helix-turn-helix domain-containing protein n=1 Tax=Lichenihabitans sp. Uapishka_5 TaxID=3037302 RepID=UPI0029E80FF5|nr:crosslink repair DNA glycosylase YcaQ family protein [Lichenihabitans sp. Uapishka_5]MDX7951927.1 crosslink repair DNA glycosylase YcaQ family protein [Lichenihabitans sp. Uapishka_5]